MVAGSQKPSALRAAMARRSRSGPFLGHAAEEEEALTAGDGGMGLEEGGGVVVVGVGDAFGAVAHHDLVHAVEPERFAGEEPLLLTGEANGIGGVEGEMNGPGPEEPFLEMLEGIAVAKPGIQHPVGVNEEWRGAAADGEVGGQEMGIPDAIHHHGVVAAAVSVNPAAEGEGKEPVGPVAAAGLNRNARKAEPGGTG
jgi:hypothetical protein